MTICTRRFNAVPPALSFVTRLAGAIRVSISSRSCLWTNPAAASSLYIDRRNLDALSLTRERVRVWVSGNLSLQKLNNSQKKDRHPLPPLSHRKMGEGTEGVAFRSFSQPFVIYRQSLVRERASENRNTECTSSMRPRTNSAGEVVRGRLSTLSLVVGEGESDWYTSSIQSMSRTINHCRGWFCPRWRILLPCSLYGSL
jgi:hypothetical protein